jgi:hypothetical protein
VFISPRLLLAPHLFPFFLEGEIQSPNVKDSESWDDCCEKNLLPSKLNLGPTRCPLECTVYFHAALLPNLRPAFP